MLYVVIVLCCLAAALVVRALAGPERWHQKVRSQIRPDVAAPTESGFRLLFWRNWAVAVIAVAIAVWGIDELQLSEEELHEAAVHAVATMDGTTDGVTQDRIRVAVEDLVPADLRVREIKSQTSEGEVQSRYEITEASATDDDPDRMAVCVKVSSIERQTRSGVFYSSTGTSPGPCTD
ncbi:hypothetical protein Kfla_0228 [Kribbella flavida DSM 17836]|uniref:Uncharacterized protein n=1 Tax=Kribbella flavida (strain DSM 17836 / JCM 10339 / NBRC 14399) TaxID=479435 RepID=D2PT39_KRIFD|nr:hypothetical protein [Kribbella flavida]ADB29355.1 hypothetical protein Kfla_0228 [Kribbella flavida DSM 17836]